MDLIENLVGKNNIFLSIRFRSLLYRFLFWETILVLVNNSSKSYSVIRLQNLDNGFSFLECCINLLFKSLMLIS